MVTECALHSVAHALVLHHPLPLVPRVAHAVLLPARGRALLGLPQLASFHLLLVRLSFHLGDPSGRI